MGIGHSTALAFTKKCVYVAVYDLKRMKEYVIKMKKNVLRLNLFTVMLQIQIRVSMQ